MLRRAFLRQESHPRFVRRQFRFHLVAEVRTQSQSRLARFLLECQPKKIAESEDSEYRRDQGTEPLRVPSFLPAALLPIRRGPGNDRAPGGWRRRRRILAANAGAVPPHIIPGRRRYALCRR